MDDKAERLRVSLSCLSSSVDPSADLQPSLQLLNTIQPLLSPVLPSPPLSPSNDAQAGLRSPPGGSRKRKLEEDCSPAKTVGLGLISEGDSKCVWSLAVSELRRPSS